MQLNFGALGLIEFQTISISTKTFHHFSLIETTGVFFFCDGTIKHNQIIIIIFNHILQLQMNIR